MAVIENTFYSPRSVQRLRLQDTTKVEALTLGQ